MQVKEVMKEVVAIEKDISIKEAAKIMSEKEIGSLIFIRDGQIKGILTEKDITKSASNTDKKVSGVMRQSIVTINEDQDIEEAAEAMKLKKIKHLPVIDDDEKLVGIITATDIIENSGESGEDFFFQ